jgi:hypothetical protein
MLLSFPQRRSVPRQPHTSTQTTPTVSSAFKLWRQQLPLSARLVGLYEVISALGIDSGRITEDSEVILG